MRIVPALAVLALSICSAGTGHATVAVHGMNQDAIGGATLSVATGPGGAKQLIVANIGSSGNDGVSVDLPSSNGLSVVYGTPPPDGLPVVKVIHRDLAVLLAQPSLGGAPHHLIEDQGASGTGVDLKLVIPGSPELLIELFNGSTLVHSARKGYDYYQTNSGMLHLDGPSVQVDEPGVAVAFRFGRPTFNTALNHACSIEMIRPAPCDVTLDGVAVVADRVVISFPLAANITGDVRAETAIWALACSGGSSDARMAINEKGLPGTKPVKKPTHRQLVVSALSGVTLESASSTSAMQRIRIVPTSTDPVADPPTVSLWALPSSTPVRAMDEVTVRWDPPTFVMPPGNSLKMGAMSGGIERSGYGGIVVSAQVTCTAITPASYEWTAQSDDPTQGGHIELYKRAGSTTVVKVHEGAPSTFGLALGRSSTKPRTHVSRCESGLLRMSFGMPPGTTITVDGTPYDADSLVVAFAPNGVTALGITELKLGPSLGTQVTIISADAASGFKTDGKIQICHRFTKFVAEIDDRYSITNIGSSGNDGVSFFSNGLPSVQMPFANGFVLAPGTGIRMEADPCDDGECAPVAALVIRRKGGTASNVWTFSAPLDSYTNPVFIENANQGQMPTTPLRSLDYDGDGEVELYPLPGSVVSFSSLAYRQLSPYRECWEMQFQTPVNVLVAGELVSVQGLKIWRNISGQPIGAGAPSVSAITLDGLAPGGATLGVTDVVGTISGNKFEGVTVSGTGTDNTLANNNIDGFPVVPTWATISGPGQLIDPDYFGPAKQKIVQAVFKDAAGNSVSSPIVIRAESDPILKYARRNGYVMQADFSRVSGGSTGAGIDLAVSGTVNGLSEVHFAAVSVLMYPTFGPANGIRHERAAGFTGVGAVGGPISIAYDRGTTASSVVCDAYMGSTLVGSFPYTGAFTCDRAPSTLALHTPPSSGGALYGECRFSAPAILPNGEILVVFDRLSFRPATDVAVVVASSCEATFLGLAPGTVVDDFRLGQIVPESVILAAPGTDGPGALPLRFALSQAWPNPMQAASAVRFSLPAKQHVRAVVMDVAGRQVAQLADQDYEAGEHTLRWNGMGVGGSPAPAGLYFVRVERGNECKVARVTRLR